jgi:hypothetical protein
MHNAMKVVCNGSDASKVEKMVPALVRAGYVVGLNSKMLQTVQ